MPEGRLVRTPNEHRKCKRSKGNWFSAFQILPRILSARISPSSSEPPLRHVPPSPRETTAASTSWSGAVKSMSNATSPAFGAKG